LGGRAVVRRAVRLNMKVFISYARKDCKLAQKLFNDLRSNGINAWLDVEDLLPGQNWKTTIENEIQNSTHFIALLSTNSINKRGFFQKELKFAINVLDEIPISDIYFIPVRLEECKPNHRELQELHWVDLFPDYNNGLDKILEVLTLKIDYEPKCPYASYCDLEFESFGFASEGGEICGWQCYNCGAYFRDFESGIEMTSEPKREPDKTVVPRKTSRRPGE
jgi:hypothetical protein